MLDNKCPLCEREGCVMTEHHLIPVHKGGKTEDKVKICNECHRQIHAIFTNEELAFIYNSIEKLKESIYMKKFFSFINKQKPFKKIKFKQCNRKNGR